jgi:hypothetical protein
MAGFLSLEIALITLSVVVAAFSYRGQKQTQMRESLEQLDDTVLSSTHKAAILLHNYNIFRRRTKLNFRIYYTPYSGGQGSKVEAPFDKLSNEERNEFLEKIQKFEGEELPPIVEVDVRDYDAIITVKSINPVAVRRAADEIVLTFADRYSGKF